MRSFLFYGYTCTVFSDQVLDYSMDIRTVKHTIWKGVGDMKLYYRETKSSNDDDDEQNTTSVANSN